MVFLPLSCWLVLVAEDFVHINFRQACPDLIEEGFYLLFGRILEPWMDVFHRLY